MAVTLSNHHDVEDNVTEMVDELYRLADHLEANLIEEATASFDELRERMEALRVYITNLEAK